MRAASVIDTLMAATAQVFDLVLVTRNVKDVAWTGVSCLNLRPAGQALRRAPVPCSTHTKIRPLMRTTG
jgi:hypothetical protein